MIDFRYKTCQHAISRMDGRSGIILNVEYEV